MQRPSNRTQPDERFYPRRGNSVGEARLMRFGYARTGIKRRWRERTLVPLLDTFIHTYAPSSNLPTVPPVCFCFWPDATSRTLSILGYLSLLGFLCFPTRSPLKLLAKQRSFGDEGKRAQVPQTLFASPLRLSRTGDRLDPESAAHASPYGLCRVPLQPQSRSLVRAHWLPATCRNATRWIVGLLARIDGLELDEPMAKSQLERDMWLAECADSN